MRIDYLAEAPHGRQRRKYGELIAAIISTDQWVRVALGEVGGKDPRCKRAAVLQAAHQAGVSVRTRVDQEYLYATRSSADGVL